MYSISQYTNETLMFTNTLVIKLSDVAIAVNKKVEELYGLEVDKTDPTTWRYYQNLAGIRHETNNIVYITLRENNTKVELTKDILLKYTTTREELFKQDSYYKELITNYPDDIDYILGCMYNVDLNTVINAVDGKILGYNKKFIYKQEISIIKELEKYIINFLHRWRNTGYIVTDNLYTASLLAVLYANIPAKLMNLRLAKANTAEAHPFHIEHFFRSNMSLWDDVTVLNQESLFWLYANLKTIMKHIGKESTLQKLINNVFEKNGIGVGEYILQVQTPEVSYSKDITLPSYTRPANKFVTKELNKSYLIKRGYTLSESEMLKRELEITKKALNIKSKEELDSITKSIVKDIDNKVISDQKTKILDLAIPEIVILHNNDPLLYIIEKWIYNVATDRYIIPITYIEPNTKHVYSLTPYEGLLILFKLMLDLTGNKNVKLTKVMWEHIENINNDFDTNKLLNGLFGRHQTAPIIDKIISKIPTEIGTFYNTDEYKEYMTKQFDLLRTIWLASSNADNVIVSVNIGIVIRRLISRGYLVFSSDDNPKTIDELLSEHNINYVIEDNYDKIASIKELVKTFTGIDIDYTAILDMKYNKFKNILTKLTSYSVQLLDNIDKDRVTFIPYITPNILYMSNGKGDVEGDTIKPSIPCKNWHGLITVLSGEIVHPLEQEIFWMYARGNDFKEKSIAIAIPFDILAQVCCDKLGVGIINYKQKSLPVTTVQIYSNCVPYYYLNIDGYGNDYKDKYIDIITNEITPRGRVHKDYDIVALELKNTDRPITTVSLADEVVPEYTVKPEAKAINYKDRHIDIITNEITPKGRVHRDQDIVALELKNTDRPITTVSLADEVVPEYNVPISAISNIIKENNNYVSNNIGNNGLVIDNSVSIAVVDKIEKTDKPIVWVKL